MAPDRLGKGVLIIDDDPAFTEALRIGLEHAGIEARVCHVGEQGVQAAMDFRPDLIVLDILMPGIHGIEVLSQLRNVPELIGTRIIITSAMSDQLTEEQVMRLGAEFAPKGDDNWGIVARVKRSLGIF